jgi:hypothetical protein
MTILGREILQEKGMNQEIRKMAEVRRPGSWGSRRKE